MITPLPNLLAASEGLSPMERELLTYVEQLLRALEDASEQFEALEKRSTAMIVSRQAVLEESLKSLIASQTFFMTAWLASEPSSGEIATKPDILRESFTALEEAAKALEQLAHPSA